MKEEALYRTVWRTGLGGAVDLSKERLRNEIITEIARWKLSI